MISIVILTCNRPEALLENLEIISKQAYYNKEIVIVDNGNSEKTRMILPQDKYDYVYIDMHSNIGCDARNYGIKASHGEIIVTLDDDVLFTDIYALNKIGTLFKKKPEVSVVNFKIVSDDNRNIIPFNWYHPRDYCEYGNKEFETDYISEGAAAFRGKIFKHVGYYPAEFFLSHEGPDLAYRILDANYKIIYSPEIEVIHKVSKIQRTSWRNSYYDTRNQIWLGIRNFPVPMLIYHLICRIGTTFLFCTARGHVWWYFKALFDALKGLPWELKNRKPISKETVNRLRMIRKLKPGFFYKARVFIEKMQLAKRYYN